MLPVKETKHVETARDLLIGQFKKRRVIQGFLDTYVRRIQDAEDVIWDVIDARILDDATNAQLDSLGDLVGEKRLGRTDVMYRASIRLRIRVNRSKGRITDVIDVASLAADPTSPPDVIEYQYLAFEVDLFDLTGERYVAELLSKTRAATSYGLLVASDLPLASLLEWDDVVSPDASIQTFSDAASGTGRVCASGYGLPTDFSGIVLGSAPIFDPATLALSAWFKPNFTGAPWTPTASAGTSGANGNLASGGSAPSTGAALNGKTGATFNGTTQTLIGSTALSSLLTAAAWSLAVLVNPAATAVAKTVGAGYSDPPIVSDDTNGFWQLTYTTSGFTFSMYDGVSWKEVSVAAASGSYHLVQAWYDGANLWLQVDSGAAVSVAAGNLGSAGGPGFLRLGANYTGAVLCPNTTEDLMIASADLGSTARANLKSYANATYALAL
jgi:hypothetical protein